MALKLLARTGGPTTSVGALPARTLVDVAAELIRTAMTFGDRLAEAADCRTGLRLVASEDYDAWLLRWPPGSSVAPHDHGDSTGVFSVVSGELSEIRWMTGLRRSRLIRPGEVVTVERGVVHDVVAPTHPSLSVHVYSPPLAAMSFYDAGGLRVVRHETIDDATSSLATSLVLH